VKKTFAALALLATAPVWAAEGMWTLDNLPADKIAKEYGFRPDADWSRHAMRASARLAGGCSGSYISPDGLVLTNHHCVVRCLEDNSSAGKNHLRDGFLAKTRAEELQCPGVELNRLEEIRDVSKAVKAALAGLSGEKYVQAERAITAKLTAECSAGDPKTTRCDVVDLYHGGQYHLYRYHRFQDVRLAFAPEGAIAHFGGDPDNFNFPRYALDAALLRAYENGKPAVVRDYFKVNPAGAGEGELVFVTGHPGHTDRQLTIAQLEARRDLDLTQGLLVMAEKRGVLTEYRHVSPEASRLATSDLYGIENGFKALNGQLRTLQDPAFWQAKRKEEEALRSALKKLPNQGEDPFQAIATATATYRGLYNEYRTYEGRHPFWSRYVLLARLLVRGTAERAKPDAERLPEFSAAALPRQEQLLFSAAPIDPAYEKLKLTWALTKLREWLGTDDPRVQAVLGKSSPEQLAARLATTRLGDPAFRRALWQGGAAAIAASDDPMIVFARTVEPHALAVRKRVEAEVDAVIRRQTERLAAARFALSGTNTYPDATFTLRLSYGEVRGWQEGSRGVPAMTRIDGTYTRATDAEPYVLPASWIKSRPLLNPAQPFNMATTNDIIGGNSGSPVINRKLEVVGLAFDGNIHSLGGDYWYDPRLNRAVAVHSGAIVEALEKIYGGSALAKEMLGQ